VCCYFRGVWTNGGRRTVKNSSAGDVAYVVGGGDGGTGGGSDGMRGRAWHAVPFGLPALRRGVSDLLSSARRKRSARWRGQRAPFSIPTACRALPWARLAVDGRAVVIRRHMPYRGGRK